MRLRREPEMISWLRRSLGVMELMMASRRTNCFSSTFCAACCMPAKGPTDGSILRMISIEPSFLICFNWSRKSSSVKPSPSSAFLANSSDFLRSSVDFGLFDERHHVAHAQDAADDAVGMERLEGVGLFAGADELDGLAGDVANGERRAAARVAVHLGQDHAGEAEARVKILRRVDRVLAGHGVGDEQNLLRVEQLFQPLHLGHQLFVDVQAAGGVDDQRVEAEVARLAAGFRGQPLDQRRAGSLALQVAFVESWRRSIWRRP